MVAMPPRRGRVMALVMTAGEVTALAGSMVPDEAPVLVRPLVPVALVAARVNDLDRGRACDHDRGAERGVGSGLGCCEGRCEQYRGGQGLAEHRLPPCGAYDADLGARRLTPA